MVGLDQRLLAVCVRRILAQDANAARFHHIGVNGPVAHNQLDERGCITKRPRHRHGKHLVAVGIRPLIVQSGGQHLNLGMLVFRHRRPKVDAKARGVGAKQKRRHLVNVRVNLVVVRRAFVRASAKQIPRPQTAVIGLALLAGHKTLLHQIQIQRLTLNRVFWNNHGFT